MMQLMRSSGAAGLAGLLFLAPAIAQTDGDTLKQDIEALKKGQQDIQKQLEEIKKMLATRPAAPPAVNVKDVVFDIGDNLVRGSDTAKLTIVEFTDYQ